MRSKRCLELAGSDRALANSGSALGGIWELWDVSGVLWVALGALALGTLWSLGAPGELWEGSGRRWALGTLVVLRVCSGSALGVLWEDWRSGELWGALGELWWLWGLCESSPRCFERAMVCSGRLWECSVSSKELWRALRAPWWVLGVPLETHKYAQERSRCLLEHTSTLKSAQTASSNTQIRSRALKVQ